MSKVEMPLMSMKASGKFGKEFVYYVRYGQNICRRNVYHNGGDSKALRKNRNLFKDATNLSKKLTRSDRAAWNEMSKGMTLNGHHLFLRAALNSFHQVHDFKPIYGVEFLIRPEKSMDSQEIEEPNAIDDFGDIENSEDNLLDLEIKYQAEADLEYFLIVGEGSFKDWAGDRDIVFNANNDAEDNDIENAKGNIIEQAELGLTVAGKTDLEGKGNFLVKGLTPYKNYWFRLIRLEGDGISAVYETGEGMGW